MLVVRPLELKQRQAELFDRLEAPHPQQILLQRADKALRDAVAFGLPHEARRAFDAEERDLLLEIVGQVVRPVVVPETQPAGHAVADAPEAFPDALADRLQGLEAGPALGGMEADARGRAVIDGHEDEGCPLGDGHGGRHVCAPHHVGRLGGDGPVVRLRPMRVARARRGLEVVLAHQPAHPLLRGAHPRDPQLRPGFPVALAMKRRGFEHPAKVGYQDVVRGRADRPAAPTQRRSFSETITSEKITEYVGVPRYRPMVAEEQNEVGIATGLAWTEAGGELLLIEAMLMPGKGQLTLTGLLGDVMQDSAQAAMSYIRARAEELGIPKEFNRKTDVHVHVPEGAIPKDGPSAGITMTTALVSTLARIPTRRDVAMTGEITLRGKVLPVGGVKEKVLAAHRAGLKTLILPKDNEKDLADIPKHVLDSLNLYMVDTMDEVLKIALAEPVRPNLPSEDTPVQPSPPDDQITH